MVTPLPARLLPGRLEAGVDEVGRGCLAGPVVATAVILPPMVSIPLLRDSKKLTPHQRLLLSEKIKEEAIAYSIAEVSAEQIDASNILRATFKAMTMAIEDLSLAPEYLLIDGNRFSTHLSIPYETIVAGDDKVGSIAAASILAKCYRDQLMQEAALRYPGYDWENNKGYGTPKHLVAIQTLGLTPLHRRSFRPCQPSLFPF